MANFAPLKNVVRSFDQAVQWLSEHGFKVSNPASGNGRQVEKYNCVAVIEPGNNGHSRLAQFPACLVAGEPAELVDRGYQKFLKTSKIEVAVTADYLQQLHRFSEELKEALGYTSLYNEGLGTVSGRYRYDRIIGRDLPESERQARPWEQRKTS